MIRQDFREVASDIMGTIAQHPDLPVMALAPSTPCDYDTYYHDATGVRVCEMLFPLEVERVYGGTYGLNPERYYTDVDEVADDVGDWLWDSTDAGARAFRPEAYDLHEWQKVYEPIARMMAEDMPWHDVVVIDCY